MSSANKDPFISSFQIGMPFISSSCLIALASFCSTTFNSSGELGHLALLWILGRKHSFIFILVA